MSKMQYTPNVIKGKGTGMKIVVSLFFLLAGAYSVLALLDIKIISYTLPGEILLWITSIGCLMFGIMYMFKK